MKEALLAFGSLVKEFGEHPRTTFLALSIALNVFLLMRHFGELDRREAATVESARVMAKIYEKSDSISHIAIYALEQKSILKDTLLNIKDREYRQLLQKK